MSREDILTQLLGLLYDKAPRTPPSRNEPLMKIQMANETATMDDGNSVVATVSTPANFKWKGAPRPAFSRAGNAYDPNTGIVIGTNTPRYGTGKFAQAVFIEEPSSNLLGADGFLEADGGIGITKNWLAYSSGAATGTRSMDTATTTYGRLASQKLVRTGGATADRWGVYYNLPTTVTSPNTISVLVNVTQLDAGAKVRLYCDYANSGSMAITETVYVDVTAATNGWTLETLAASSNASTARGTFYVWIEGGNGTVYVQAVQSENKAYATSLTNGARNADYLTVPTTGMSSTAGTVEFWFIPRYNSSVFPATGAAGQDWIMLFDSGTASNTSEIRIGYNNGNGGEFQAFVGSSAYAVAYVRVLTAGERIHVALTWNATTFWLYINGVLVATGTVATFTFGSTASIGWGTLWNAYLCNGYIDDFYMSNVTKTTAQIQVDYSATAPLVADSNTVALLHFDGNLLNVGSISAGGWTWGAGQWK